MKGYKDNIEKVTKKNKAYRRVLYTGRYSQLVVMAVKPGDEIGEEVHGVDQFIRFEEGTGKVILEGMKQVVKADDVIIIPAGTTHNVINTGKTFLKLYTLYSPPDHKDKTLDQQKKDENKHEHFDGKTSE